MVARVPDRRGKFVAAGLGAAYSLTAPNTAPSASALPAAQIIAASDVQYQHDSEVLPSDASDYGLSVAKIIKAGLILDNSAVVQVICYEGAQY